MTNSLPESITNWHNDRSMAFGRSIDSGDVARARQDELLPATMMTGMRSKSPARGRRLSQPAADSAQARPTARPPPRRECTRQGPRSHPLA